jgi:sulfatase modifying factor 1
MHTSRIERTPPASYTADTNPQGPLMLVNRTYRRFTALCTLGIAASFGLVSACSDEFSNCRETHTCPKGGSGPGGGAGEAGAADTADVAGAPGSMAGSPNDATAGVGGGDGDGGSGGEGGSPVISCVPNAEACDGNRVTVCNAEGTGYVGPGVSCAAAETCWSGVCEPQECLPSARFCAGKTVRQCSENGLSSEEVATCDADQYCDAETTECTPGVCAPDWPACDGPRATTCNASGSGYLAGGTVCSASETCESGSCKPHVCEPNQTFCQGQTVKSCAADGLSSTVVSACTNQACVEDGDTASCKGECAPGQSRCSNNGVQTCDANGVFGTAAACTNKTCVVSGTTASCVGVCAPQQKQCSDNGVRTCNATGQYSNVVACPALTPTCSGAGVCGSPRSCNSLGNICGANGDKSCCASTVVPGGTFNRSNNASCPATVSAFRLDNYEVTVGRFRRFAAVYSPTMITEGTGNNPNDANDLGWRPSWNSSLPATAAELRASVKCESSAGYVNWTDTEGSALNEARPMNCLSWYEANAFCTWDGGRLPTEAEWNYAAAGGTAQRVYPWGNNAPGNNANLAVMGCYYNGTGDCNDGLNHFARVGSVPAGDALWGHSNMAGNVSEWTLDFYESEYPSGPCVDCANHAQSFVKVRRGGGISEIGTPLTTMYRGSTQPDLHYTDVGVRCVRAP